MKKNLLKSFRVFCKGLIVAVMCLNLCVSIQAEENKEHVEQNHVSGIQELYRKIYSGDQSVSLVRDGEDITDEFVNGTKYFYKGGNTQFIGYLLSADSIDIIEEHDIVPYSITSRSITKTLTKQLITGTSALTQKPVYDECTMYITFTIVWDQTTEKISGNPRTPSIKAESENGTFESLVVTSVQSNGKITNGGFSVQYTQISATLKGTNSLDDWSVDQYYNYNWSGNYTFTPANGLS